MQVSDIRWERYLKFRMTGAVAVLLRTRQSRRSGLFGLGFFLPTSRTTLVNDDCLFQPHPSAQHLVTISIHRCNLSIHPQTLMTSLHSFL